MEIYTFKIFSVLPHLLFVLSKSFSTDSGKWVELLSYNEFILNPGLTQVTNSQYVVFRSIRKGLAYLFHWQVIKVKTKLLFQYNNS